MARFVMMRKAQFRYVIALVEPDESYHNKVDTYLGTDLIDQACVDEAPSVSGVLPREISIPLHTVIGEDSSFLNYRAVSESTLVGIHQWFGLRLNLFGFWFSSLYQCQCNGVSAESFIQAFTLAQSAFNVQLASPNGRPVEFVGLDDNSRRWLNDFRTKSYAMPISFEAVEEPICTIGMGVAALFCCHCNNQWRFANYSLTSTTVFELAKEPYFSDMKIIPEDYIRDHGGRFAGGEPSTLHVVLDRHLITGQNESSTLVAVQNLILISNQKLSNGK
ncbi:hypothetical protein CAPTEDRAFT_219247 [Capitella teleta]|uniref:Uncharacterized protein n=1 Tax=Capitella teleta TaxID=283909 RepID=R7V2Y3_CAPTE|nr:hypothetical protein CAPTEDRAFT_219247 [Capitella teleta]|eukprot:ELU12852.1 hypothetical protein CAPTEDRAFT_219247 [Capitella teleta]